VSDPEVYADLARRGPIASVIGAAIISLVEPLPGREQEFNRWYEDDHMIVSAMACPWVFSGRRWVATRALRDLRLPEDSAVIQPVDEGCFLATFWILDGRYDEFMAWARALVADRLMPVGRMSPPRRHVFTSDQSYAGAAYRDAGGPRDVHALDYPYAGLVMQVIDAATQEGREALVDWVLETYAPARLKGSSAAMCLVFRSMIPPRPKPGVDWYDRRLTLLWLLEDEPDGIWPSIFADQEAVIAASGLGRLELAAPFIPVLPGTDRYLDELR
jgi:hypothetical protein